MFVSIEPTASSDRAKVEDIGANYDFLYALDIVNAPTNSNTDEPGKYVVDMNGK